MQKQTQVRRRRVWMGASSAARRGTESQIIPVLKRRLFLGAGPGVAGLGLEVPSDAHCRQLSILRPGLHVRQAVLLSDRRAHSHSHTDSPALHV